MTKDTLGRTQEWFRKAKPAPTPRDFQTQLGVHVEEVNEMLLELKGNDHETQLLVNVANAGLNALARHLKSGAGTVTMKDPTAFLDALCDQIVTAVGCGRMAGMDIIGAMQEVNASNFSKFNDDGTPIFDDNRKVMKGPNYRKPVLEPFVNR